MASARLVRISGMEWLQSANLLAILEALLPGFVAAWVFYGLTPHPRGNQFERVVQAFVFLAFIRLAMMAVELVLTNVKRPELILGPWTKNVAFCWSIAIAVAFGLLFSALANTDLIHGLFRDWGITKRTSFPNNWASVFNRHARKVVLHLKPNDEGKDGHRIMGEPLEFPEEDTKGHFVLQNACWLQDDDEEVIDLKVVHEIVINVNDVRFVETLKEGSELECHADGD
jgi:hypothetical protein